MKAQKSVDGSFKKVIHYDNYWLNATMQYQVSILRYMIYGAVEMGADFNEICKRINITPEELNDGEAYIKWEPGEEKDFWVHAVELTNDPCVGLKIGALRI